MSMDRVESQKKGRDRIGSETALIFRVKGRRRQQVRLRHGQREEESLERVCTRRQGFESAASWPGNMQTYSTCWDGYMEFMPGWFQREKRSKSPFAIDLKIRDRKCFSTAV